MTEDDARQAKAWLDAARREDVASALEAIYRDTAGEIEARGPSCWASGRCCNFEAFGHRLYVTGLEAAYTVDRAEPDGAAPRRDGLALPVLAGESVDSARARGGCPYQAGNLCSVHAIKPLGCRVFFCDRSAQGWQNDLHERMHERVKRLHEAFALPYRYGEWRAMLGLLTS